MATSPKPPLSFNDYQRTFRVIMGVVEAMHEQRIGPDPGHACVFFAYAGALILNRNYGLSAVPFAGASMVRVNDDEPGFVVTFGGVDGNTVTFDGAFHSWVVCENQWAIDFMAPMFQEAINSARAVPRRMFQKPLSQAAATPDDLQKAGDFFLLPDGAHSREVFLRNMRMPAVRDLGEVCVHWHRPFGKAIKSTMKMESDDGRVTTLRLSNVSVEGTW